MSGLAPSVRSLDTEAAVLLLRALEGGGMRTRLIRPEFFSDEVMARLPAAVRLTYIGLWTLADDAGYLVWHPVEIAAELYRYAPARSRAKQVAAHLELLIAAGRVVVLDCGNHAVVPTIPNHRIKGGEQLLTVEKRHRKQCVEPVLRRTTESSLSVSVSDSVSDSLIAQARRRKMADAAAAAGGFAATLAKKPA